MKRFVALVFGLCILWPSVTRAEDSKKPPIEHELQVFRLSGTFKIKTTLSPWIWGEGDGRKSDKRDLVNNQDVVTLFDEGKFSWGRDHLELHDNGCFWNSRKLNFNEGNRPQLPEDKLRLISYHSLVRPLETLIRLKIASDSPFQYMERQSDGLFALKETSLPVGMDVEIRAEQRDEGGLRVAYLELELRSVGSREPIDGVTLPIGKPKMKEWEYVLRFNVMPQRGYGVLIRPQGTTGAMLIRVALNEHTSTDH